MSIDHPLTFTYKSVETVSHSQAFKLDIYLPEQSDSASPILVYYHAGGLVAGSRARNDWFPEWLLRMFLPNIRSNNIKFAKFDRRSFSLQFHIHISGLFLTLSRKWS